MRIIFITATLIAMTFLQIIQPTTENPVIVTRSECSANYKQEGCYLSDRKALPKLLFSDRLHHSDTRIDWDHFDTYLANLACRCSTKAKDNHYLYFGLQYYAECWAGNSAVFRENGPLTTGCVNATYDPCVPGSPMCVGKANVNYVYQVVPAAECKDKSLDCAKWESFCSQYDGVRKACQRTCKQCP